MTAQAIIAKHRAWAIAYYSAEALAARQRADDACTRGDAAARHAWAAIAARAAALAEVHHSIGV